MEVVLEDHVFNELTSRELILSARAFHVYACYDLKQFSDKHVEDISNIVLKAI